MGRVGKLSTVNGRQPRCHSEAAERPKRRSEA